MGKYDALLNKLNIDETFTKPPKQKQKVFNKVKDNIPLIKDYNFMADIVDLPTTKQGYKCCLVVVDLASDAFDIEPLKNKESKNTLQGLKTIFKRKYLNEPYMSLTTDGGPEFKSVFHKWLYDEGIDHRTTLPYRHKQMGNVESLNKQLGRLFNGYMNRKERETGKVFKEWTDVVPIIREELNNIRLKKLPKSVFDMEPPRFNLSAEPKYKVGDLVYYRHDFPHDALGNKQSTHNFRMGDFKFNPTPKKIKKVLIFPEDPTFRYMITGINNASYSEYELMPAKTEEIEEKYEVKQIIDKKKVKSVIHYLVWWKGYPKSKSTWEKRVDLINDGLSDIIEAYDASHK